MTRDFEGARVVNSVPEEYEILDEIKCDCGENFKLIMQSLVENEGKFFDVLSCECTGCQKEREFIFDINSFFGKSFG